MVDLDLESVSEIVKERTNSGDAIEVVTPAQPSRLEWFVSDEDAARKDAAQEAHKVATSLDEAGGDVEADVGDPDPIQAIEDALARFPADEILVLTRPEDDAEWLEKRAFDTELGKFETPVTHVSLAQDASGRGDGLGD